jgi:integrase
MRGEPGFSRALIPGSRAALQPKSNNSTDAVVISAGGLPRDVKAPRDLHYITAEEAAKTAMKLRQPRWQALARFLWLSGARISEALAVRVQDIDTRSNVVHLTTLKRRKPVRRAVPLPESDLAGLLLVAARGRLEPGDRLWPFGRVQAFRRLQTAMLRAGVRPDVCHPHAIRHGHAIHALRNGMSLELVSRNLGHANIQTTSIYLRATGADVRRAYDRINW